MGADLTFFARCQEEFNGLYLSRRRGGRGRSWVALLLLLGGLAVSLFAGCATAEKLKPKTALDVVFLPVSVAMVPLEFVSDGLAEMAPPPGALSHVAAQVERQEVARIQAENRLANENAQWRAEMEADTAQWATEQRRRSEQAAAQA